MLLARNLNVVLLLLSLPNLHRNTSLWEYLKSVVEGLGDLWVTPIL